MTAHDIEAPCGAVGETDEILTIAQVRGDTTCPACKKLDRHDMDEVSCPECFGRTVRGMVTNYGKCSLCLKDEHLARKASR